MTFLPRVPRGSDTLDILSLNTTVIQKFGYSSSDFWELPLFMVFKLLGVFTDPLKQPISRKQQIDEEREINVRFGNV